MNGNNVGLLMPKSEKRPRQVKFDSAVDISIRAEELGFHSIWYTEGWEENAFVRLGEIASHTDEIQLATGITGVFARTPATLAMSSVTVQRLSKGRFILGIGPGHRKDIEDTHGIPYERPVRRIHETVEIVKLLTQGNDKNEDIEYNGDIFQISNTTPLESEYPMPVFNAALGPANRRATGRVCDGWIPHNLPFSTIERLSKEITTTSRQVGRKSADIQVNPLIPTVVSENGETAKNELRKHIAYYVGSWKEYREAFAEEYPEKAKELETTFADVTPDTGRIPDEIDEIIGDDILEAFGVAGTPKTARNQFNRIVNMDFIDVPILFVPLMVSKELTRRTIEEINPRTLSNS